MKLLGLHMSGKKAATDDIVSVVVEPSGAVSLDVGRFLRSGAGQRQLEAIRTLRDFAARSRAQAKRKTRSETE